MQAQENTTLVREEVTDAERRCEEKQLKLWKMNFKQEKGYQGTRYQPESQMSIECYSCVWLNWKPLER